MKPFELGQNRTADPDFKNMTWDKQKALVETADRGTRLRLAHSPYTNVGVLHLLVNDPDEEVRCAVAKSPYASDTTLIRLARDRSPEVQQCVASNPETPFYACEVLAKSKDTKVLLLVREHQNCPDDVREKLWSELQ